MAIDIQINITDHATPSLVALANNVNNRRPLHAHLGAHAETTLKNYFARRDQQPNKRGWPSQHFWDQIRSATALTKVDEDGASITIADERMNQKVYGGTIKPKESKYLALPAIAEAYGKSPRLFNNLHPVIRFRNGERRAIGLAENLASEIKFGRQTIWYWLVESVTQLKDELALPDDEGFAVGLRDAADEYFEQFIR